MNLPNNIDYSKYESNNGLSTKHWGKAGWYFLFSCVAGYPVKIDNTNTEHIKIKREYEKMFSSLAFTMPCIFCRNSFKQFLELVPIKRYLSGRIHLMYWLYLVRDLVNKKLIKQERECYREEKKRLKQLFYSNTISEKEYYKSVQEFKIKTVLTQSSPPFEVILDKYESIRATCSAKSKTCAIKEK